jgi:hypothetical protein
MIKNRLLPAALLAATVLTTGCVVTPEPYYGSVRVAPPPLRQEYPGYAPYADYVWIAGYWGWAGARYEWIPGRWEAPRHGHIWVPHRWERDGDRWRQSGGRWEEDHRPRPAPRIEVQPAPRIEIQSAPRYERDSPPPRREWGGDSRQAPPPERDSRPRYEQRDGGRPPEASRDFRQERGSVQRQESRPAPAMAPAQQPSQMRRDERSRDERKDDSRSKRRQRDDDR